jgi:hypothetical protein
MTSTVHTLVHSQPPHHYPHREPCSTDSPHPPRMWAGCHKDTRLEGDTQKIRSHRVGPSIGLSDPTSEVSHDLAVTDHVRHMRRSSLLLLIMFARSQLIFRKIVKKKIFSEKCSLPLYILLRYAYIVFQIFTISLWDKIFFFELAP